MCKTKAYTENMDAMNESVAFRFDFYSMPSFKNNFVELLRKNLPVQQFTERLLTEEEKQKINIDAISYTLDNSIEEIISKKIYKFEQFHMANCMAELYIGPYFLFLYLKRKREEQVRLKELDTVFNLLKSKSSELNLLNTTCILSFNKYLGENDLWKIFDKDAFPSLDTETMTVGRYADSHLYGNMNVELVRVLSKGFYEKEDGEVIDPCFYVNIIANGTIPQLSLQSDDFPIILSKLFNQSQNEATKCFIN